MYFRLACFSILLLAAIQGFSQEKSGPLLFNETNIISCDELKAQIEGFYGELKNNSSSTGLVLIFGKPGKRLESLIVEQTLKNFIDYRKFNKSITKFAFAKTEKNIKIQFWLMPPGANKPDYIENPSSYSLPNVSKAFVLYQALESSIGDCDTDKYNFDELYSKLLLNNPNLHGHLVISAASNKEFIKARKELLTQLVHRFIIPRSKLEFFYTKTKDSWDIDYWIVPKAR